jgi:hypothetical protein
MKYSLLIYISPQTHILDTRKHNQRINSKIIYVEVFSYFVPIKQTTCGASLSMAMCNFRINEHHPMRLNVISSTRLVLLTKCICYSGLTYKNELTKCICYSGLTYKNEGST